MTYILPRKLNLMTEKHYPPTYKFIRAFLFRAFTATEKNSVRGQLISFFVVKYPYSQSHPKTRNTHCRCIGMYLAWLHLLVMPNDWIALKSILCARDTTQGSRLPDRKALEYLGRFHEHLHVKQMTGYLILKFAIILKEKRYNFT